MLQPAYYFISHFSRFIPNGSKRIAFSKYTEDLEASCFITPEGKRVIVVMNSTKQAIPYVLKDVSSKKIARLIADAKSIYTLVY